MSLTKIFSAMKKRESSFKTNLWEAVKLLTVCLIFSGFFFLDGIRVGFL